MPVNDMQPNPLHTISPNGGRAKAKRVTAASAKTPIATMPKDKRAVLICGGHCHALANGTTVGSVKESTAGNNSGKSSLNDNPDIKLPYFSIFGESIAPIHGKFIRNSEGWIYYNLGEKGSRVLRGFDWFAVDEEGIQLEDGDQIELGNGDNSSEGVFEHLFFELR